VKAVRWLATLVIWSAAIAGIAYVVVKPWGCNLIEGEVQRATDRMTRMVVDQATLVPYARRNIARMTPCLACSGDVNRAMVYAANLRFMGRQQEAIAVYRDALRYDRRPELYLNLGQTLLDVGDETEGMRTLITACKYDPDLVADIPSRHEELYAAVQEYYFRLLEDEKKRGAR
jgi:hypothetical protein